mmetsp:Transcript_1699/g.10456  ORF Transcript_1699/g.10456 Transcript_1699/m.10456 type:complete len:82 (-) Transcript_1699:1756-2001(-)
MHAIHDILSPWSTAYQLTFKWKRYHHNLSVRGEGRRSTATDESHLLEEDVFDFATNLQKAIPLPKVEYDKMNCCQLWYFNN